MRFPLVLVLFTGCTALGGEPELPVAPAGGELLATSSPPVWFEGFWTPARVSPRGDRAILGEQRSGDLRVLDIHTGVATPLAAAVGAITHATFTAAGDIAVSGARDGREGWFLLQPDGSPLLTMPSDALPVWAPGNNAAWFRRAAADSVIIESPTQRRAVHVPGPITSMAWGPGGSWLLVLAGGDDGASTLYRVGADAGAPSALVRDLDAPINLFGTHRPIAISPDGERAYVPLASAGPPEPESRHHPAADRDLDIYEVDLRTGARRVVAATAGDDFGPVVADGWLYWSASSVEQAAVVLPAVGGEARVMVPGAMLPTWRPDGRALGFTFGDWRQADWVLNWDAGIVALDAEARPIGEPRPLIQGYHEDFSPVWSPDGRWIAYHSHRSDRPVAHYHDTGSTDDIFLRREGSDDEIRLTYFGVEIGPPSWAPDGQRLVYTGWLAHGGSGAWVTTIDTATGLPLRHRPVPLPADVGGAANATWSPVDDVIAILAPTPGRRVLWTVHPDGSVVARLADVPLLTYGGLAWTPDGRALVFPAIVDGRMQLHSVPAGGGAIRPLTRDDANLLHPALSPDGRWIAATRLRHTRELRRAPLP